MTTEDDDHGSMNRDDTIVAEPGWYWARRRSAKPGARWVPVYIALLEGGDRWVWNEGRISEFAETHEIGPMLAEQGPSQPVMRVEITASDLEPMVREHVRKGLGMIAEAQAEPPMDLLLEVWNDGFGSGYERNGTKPDVEASVLDVLARWKADR